MRAREAARSERACVFEIAVATSSVNWRSRTSVPSGIGSGWVEWTANAPHSRPSMMIGEPTDEVTPAVSRTYSANGPSS